jgi:hypothetical protein
LQLSLSAAVKKKSSDVPVFVIYAGIIHAIALALFLPMLISLPGPRAVPHATPPAEISAVDVVVLPAQETLTDIGPDQTSSLPSPHRAEEGAAGAAAPEAGELKPAPETKDSISTSAAPEHSPEREAKDSASALVPEGEAQTEPIGASHDALPSDHPAVSEPNHAVANVAPAAEPAVQPPEPQAAKPSQAERPPKTKTATPKTETATLTPQAPKKAIVQPTRTPSSPPSRRVGNTARSQTKFTPFNGFFNGLFGPTTARGN